MGVAMVRVWNDNKHDFVQDYKGVSIAIPAGKFVEMQWDEAVEFKSLFYPPEFRGDGQQKAESFKMLRIDGDPPHLRGESISEHVCASCGDKFASENDLDAHIDRHHLDDLEDPDVAAKRRARKKA